jgi:hypothetical protein
MMGATQAALNRARRRRINIRGLGSSETVAAEILPASVVSWLYGASDTQANEAAPDTLSPLYPFQPGPATASGGTGVLQELFNAATGELTPGQLTTLQQSEQNTLTAAGMDPATAAATATADVTGATGQTPPPPPPPPSGVPWWVWAALAGLAGLIVLEAVQ